MSNSTRMTSISISFDIPTGSRCGTRGVATASACLGDERRSEAEPRGGHITFMRMRAAARLPAGRHAFEAEDIASSSRLGGNSRAIHALSNK